MRLADIKSEETKATLCNGVLKITLPKVAKISKTKTGIEELAPSEQKQFVNPENRNKKKDKLLYFSNFFFKL